MERGGRDAEDKEEKKEEERRNKGGGGGEVYYVVFLNYIHFLFYLFLDRSKRG